MKKGYAAPEVDTLIFETEDIITASGEFDKKRPIELDDTENETNART